MSVINCSKKIKIKELETHLKTFEERLEEMRKLKSKVQRNWAYWRMIKKHENEVTAPIEELNKSTERKRKWRKKNRKRSYSGRTLQRRYGEEKQLNINEIELQIPESIENRSRSPWCNNRKQLLTFKGLVIPKVRALIYGFLFNTKRYERAKTILKTKFGKPSEVTNTHIQCIVSLAAIKQTIVGKIYDFYEKLVTHSQASDTKWKTKEIK